MAELLRVPEVAADTTEVVLSGWQLAEGATFAGGDVLASIETDKAEVEISADSDGVLLKRLFEPGVRIGVGEPVAVLGAAGEQADDTDALLEQLGVTVATAAETETAVRRTLPGTAAEEAAPEETAAVAAEPGVASTPAPPGADRGGRVFASPLARRLARDAALDVAVLTGTGPGGRIVRRDVEAAVAARREKLHPAGAHPREEPGATKAAQAATPAGPYEDVPHTRMRRAVAGRLTESKQTIPHFYLRAQVQVDPLLALRQQINEDGRTRVSVNDLLIKAAATAHTAVPEMNAVWLPDAVRRFRHADICVAVATDYGLVTPVLRGVDTMSVSTIADRMRTTVETARAGALHPGDMAGGSITISNLGMFGVTEFGAIINPPQSAILAVGAAREEPVVSKGRVVPARVLHVVLSADHRPVDGALAARWLATFTEIVENPLRILV